MQKKTKYQILGGIICAVTLGLISFGYFAGYGGNRCNISYMSSPTDFKSLIQIGSCDCFCCKGFYGQGYESCGIFGLYFGLILGAILGISIVHLIWTKRYNQK
ncbi:MAG: hypothetical protein WC979_04140 [Candidatus Pacearchaeota archaeon]|jgi:hypothetical protein